jgi:hypothetical protein
VVRSVSRRPTPLWPKCEQARPHNLESISFAHFSLSRLYHVTIGLFACRTGSMGLARFKTASRTLLITSFSTMLFLDKRRCGKQFTSPGTEVGRLSSDARFGFGWCLHDGGGFRIGAVRN